MEWWQYLGNLVVGLLFLAVFCEGTITFFYSEIVRQWGEMTPLEFFREYSARYVALALGLGLAFGFEVDVPAVLGLVAVAPWIGIAVTGVVIGRGANYVHDLFKAVLELLRPPA